MNATEETFTREAVPVHARVRDGLGKRHNWIQLFKFVCVGGTGTVLNLAVFTLLAVGLDVHHLVAATVAFLVAVTNNFWLNRHWTFGAKDGHAGFQAARFFTVSVFAFAIQLSVLELFISSFGAPKVLAQAISLIVATPFNFLGNKMWSFGQGR
jgi:dolichol-phosphate mannosyltransferase